VLTSNHSHQFVKSYRWQQRNLGLPTGAVSRYHP